ncbi:MAG: DUF484 family protein [Pseudomonadota bacterium]|nr:DUF484 family protein [Pseudomonadota bacterium]
MSLQAQDVHDWLNAHPDFFEQHPELLASLSLPHPDTGQAVSLVERQMQALRERNRVLESRLAELIQIARDNDALSDKVQAFGLRMLAERSPERVVDGILDGLRDGFRIPHAALRVWLPGVGRGAGPEHQPVLAELREFAGGMRAPVCGQHPVYEVNRWFGEDAPRLRSFALAPLGTPAFGLLVLASEEPGRFYAEMGTTYLARLAELASAALLACRVAATTAADEGASTA